VGGENCRNLVAAGKMMRVGRLTESLDLLQLLFAKVVNVFV
jgi:hypothetical protein